LHFQGEHVHKSKKMNKIIFVWNVRKWKPIIVDASETGDRRWCHDFDARTHKMMTCSLSLSFSCWCETSLLFDISVNLNRCVLMIAPFDHSWMVCMYLRSAWLHLAPSRDPVTPQGHATRTFYKWEPRTYKPCAFCLHFGLFSRRRRCSSPGFRCGDVVSSLVSRLSVLSLWAITCLVQSSTDSTIQGRNQDFWNGGGVQPLKKSTHGGAKLLQKNLKIQVLICVFLASGNEIRRLP
jgi:hypothetical protein